MTRGGGGGGTGEEETVGRTIRKKAVWKEKSGRLKGSFPPSSLSLSPLFPPLSTFSFN